LKIGEVRAMSKPDPNNGQLSERNSHNKTVLVDVGRLSVIEEKKSGVLLKKRQFLAGWSVRHFELDGVRLWGLNVLKPGALF
jgi:hypothetical protein